MNLDEYKAKRPPNREAVDAHKAEMEREIAAATLGFVVLAKRPAPRTEHGWEYETVSEVFKTMIQVEHALEVRRCSDAAVEYVVGEIVPVQR